jgi:pimeloyl-ACP methyl ester carboxylesterase
VLRDATLRLSDGRLLAYSEWGDPDGAPVFHFHGLPGSRLERWGGEAAYGSAGIRLITVDRPGIGRSDPKQHRTLLDWADDIEQLADALTISRFAVTGHSAGGAYALACAYRLPERVGCAALVGGVPKLDRPDGIDQLGVAHHWRVAREYPVLMRANYRVLATTIRFAPRLGLSLVFGRVAEADHALVDRPELRRRFREAVLEAARPGVRFLVDDMRVLMQPWGFEPGDVSSDVHLWHGGDDHHVPLQVAENYAHVFRRCRATFVTDEAHFSLMENRAQEILEALLPTI